MRARVDLSTKRRFLPSWTEYEVVTGAFPVRGNLVPDAHLATILRQHGVGTLYSADTDFRKFEFLEVVNPFAG
jgi:hypothetical protein